MDGSSSMIILSLKLRRFKAILKDWNKNSFGDVLANLKKVEEKARVLEMLHDSVNNAENRVSLHEANTNLLSKLREYDDFHKQRARVKRLKDGDGNYAYFHACLTERQPHLGISHIRNRDGIWVESCKDIDDAAEDFFKHLLNVEFLDGYEEASLRMLSYIPSVLTENDNQLLTRNVSHEEVRAAVFDLDAKSALGIDGFCGMLYTSCWDISANDLLNAYEEFFSGVPIPRAITNTLITLLPKKEVLNSFAGFQPISLCNFINKLFTKILTERVKPLLDRLISEEQSAFVAGRDIVDNILTAQDLCQFLNHKVRGKIAF